MAGVLGIIMKEKTPKSKEVLDYLERVFGVDLVETQKERLCVSRPIGCGKKIMVEMAPAYEAEYQLSALCPECQDAFFV